MGRLPSPMGLTCARWPFLSIPKRAGVAVAGPVRACIRWRGGGCRARDLLGLRRFHAAGDAFLAAAHRCTRGWYSGRHEEHSECANEELCTLKNWLVLQCIEGLRTEKPRHAAAAHLSAGVSVSNPDWRLRGMRCTIRCTKPCQARCCSSLAALQVHGVCNSSRA